MGIFLTCLFVWVLAAVGETSLFAVLPWFKPNLLFLFSCIFCLRWRGFETHLIAVVLGLTADSFSTIPFGIYGLSFLLISFFTRWYGIRIYQGAYAVVIAITGILTLVNQLLVSFILNLFYSSGEMTFSMLWRILSFEVLPTIVLTIPCLRFFIYLESRFKLRLAERKF